MGKERWRSEGLWINGHGYYVSKTMRFDDLKDLIHNQDGWDGDPGLFKIVARRNMFHHVGDDRPSFQFWICTPKEGYIISKIPVWNGGDTCEYCKRLGKYEESYEDYDFDDDDVEDDELPSEMEDDKLELIEILISLDGGTFGDCAHGVRAYNVKNIFTIYGLKDGGSIVGFDSTNYVKTIESYDSLMDRIKNKEYNVPDDLKAIEDYEISCETMECELDKSAPSVIDEIITNHKKSKQRRL